MAKVDDLEKVLQAEHGKLEDLQSQQADVASEASKLKQAADQSLGEVDAKDLRNQALKQAKARVELDAANIAYGELGKRISAQQVVVATAEKAMRRAKWDDLQRRADDMSIKFLPFMQKLVADFTQYRQLSHEAYELGFGYLQCDWDSSDSDFGWMEKRLGFYVEQYRQKVARRASERQ
jgi:hypothetical protein